MNKSNMQKEIRKLVNLAYRFGEGSVFYGDSDIGPTESEMKHWHDAHIDEVTKKIMSLVAVPVGEDKG